MQEGNTSLGMLKNVQFGQEIFTLSPVADITVDRNPIRPGLFSRSPGRGGGGEGGGLRGPDAKNQG